MEGRKRFKKQVSLGTLILTTAILVIIAVLGTMVFMGQGTNIKIKEAMNYQAKADLQTAVETMVGMILSPEQKTAEEIRQEKRTWRFLKLSKPTWHKVKPGETVWSIARHYRVSPYQVMKINGLTTETARFIRPGQTIQVVQTRF